MGKFNSLLWLLFDTATAMIGYTIHHSIFWACVDFFFSPLVWIKWFVFHEVTLAVIKTSFAWFF